MRAILKPGKKFGQIFPFAKQITRLIRGGTIAEVREWAAAMYDTYIKDKVFSEMIDIYLDLCSLIDYTKINSLGVEGSTVKSNGLMFCLAAEIIRRGSMDNFFDQMLLENKMAALEKAATENSGWLWAKLMNLRSLYNNRLGHTLYVKGLTVSNPEKKLEDILRLFPDAQTAIRHTMSELHRMKMYGVKSSYFSDGLMLNPGQVWVMLDHHEVNPDAFRTDWIGQTEVMAMICLTKESSITSYNTRVEHVRLGQGLVNKLELGFVPTALMNIDSQGELYYGSSEILYNPLRDEFAAKDKIAEYELLRFAHIMRLWDLMVPIERVKQVSTAKAQRGPLIERIMHVSQAITPDLILPRIRLIENHLAEIQREIEQEIDEADSQTQRTIGRHDVTHHIRHLPTGRRASPDAIKRAKEHGFDLKEGQTYIRKHQRGGGSVDNTDKIYRVVKRK